MNITIAFRIIELVNVPIFNLNWQFWKRKRTAALTATIDYCMLELIYKQWQNIIEVLKSMFKNLPLSFPHCFTMMLRGERGKKQKIVQIAVFPVFFVTDCLKNPENLSAVFYSWSFWMTLKACNYPLRHYDVSLTNFWSPNKHLKYLERWGKIFVFQIFVR